MTIPIIDFRSKDCVNQMYDAYTTVGFAVFTHVYDEWLDDFTKWKILMEEFFLLPLDVKKKYSYVDNEYIEDEEVKKDGKQYLPEQQKYSKG